MREFTTGTDSNIAGFHDINRWIRDMRAPPKKSNPRVKKPKSRVYSIPDDVLVQIFDLIISPEGDPLMTGFFAGMNFSPWLLSQVCREWRSIILSSPRLWKMVSIGSSWNPMAKKRAKGLTYLLSRQMKLSRTEPLQMNILAGTLCASPDVLELIVPHRARWETLVIHSFIETQSEYEKAGEVVDEIFTSEGTADSILEFSLLRDMQLRVSDDLLDFPENLRFPKLVSATLCLMSDLGNIPWSNLENLRLSSVMATELIPLLPSFTKMKKLVVGHMTLTKDPAQRRKRKTPSLLPCLEELEVYHRYNSITSVINAPALKEILISTHCPNLEDDDEGETEEDDLWSVANLNNRSSSSLSTLSFSLPIYDGFMEPLGCLLKESPDITMLDIILCNLGRGRWTDRFIKLASALSKPREDGRFLCPRLETIILYNDSHYWFQNKVYIKAVMDLLEARYHAQGSCLKTVKLESFWDKPEAWPSVDKVLVRRVKALRSAGLDLQIFNTSLRQMV